MASLLGVVLLVDLLFFAVAAVQAIRGRGDMAHRRRWNARLLASLAVALLTMAVFVFVLG